MVLVRSFVSMNDLITSTTCAQSIDFGTPAIVIMKDGEGRLGITRSIVELPEYGLINGFGCLAAFM